MSVAKKILFIFCLGLVLRLLLVSFGTLVNDFNTFVAWSHSLSDNGFRDFYNGWSDYLPGYLYALWFLGRVDSLGLLPAILVFKLPAIVFDLLTGVVVFYAVGRISKKLALFLSLIYVLNPAVFANSTMWGQIEGITAFFSLTAVFFAHSNLLLSSLAVSLGTLVKPQVGFIMPVLFILWFLRFGFAKALIYSCLSGMIFLLGFIPFYNPVAGTFLEFIKSRLSVTAGQYPYTSINAFNFWGLLHGFWREDLVLFQFIGLVIVGLITFLLLLYLVRQRGMDLYRSSFLVVGLLFAASFYFLTRMHERHLLPSLVFFVVSASFYRYLWIVYLSLSLTYIANLYFSHIWISDNFRWTFSPEVVRLFALVNLGVLFLGFKVIFKNFNFRSIDSYIKDMDFGESFFSKYRNVFLGLIIAFAFFTRFYSLSFPANFYFDEVYHAFTAKEMVRGNEASWVWWGKAPEGFAYEWTHPPLAKLFMAGSIFLFGEKSLSWRLPGAVLGTLVVFLIYLLGKELFKKEAIAIFSSFVFALDGLSLVMSRIGMNDTYFLFFMLLTFLFFLRGRFFWASLFFGGALASKWTALFVIPILFLIMGVFKIKPRWRIFYFFIVPFFVYFLSYIPFFLSGYGLSEFVGLQRQMWWYHTSLQATHTYYSSSLSWPLMLRPVWLFTESRNLLVSNIYAIGNPLIFWGGLFGVFLVVISIFNNLRKSKELVFLLLGWLGFFLPWSFSPRIMFLYHYLPALPFLSMISGWMLYSFWRRGYILLVFLYFALAFLLFVFFYPHWVGIFVPRAWDELYYWLPGWR